MDVRQITREECKNFFDCPWFYERHGNSLDEIDNYGLFLGIFHENELIGAVACRGNQDIVEVHTLIAKNNKGNAVEGLQSVINFLKSMGIRSLITYCPQEFRIMRNFLIKRLGFEELEYKDDAYTLVYFM